MNHSLTLAVEAALSTSAIKATIVDQRPDSLSVFQSLNEAQHVQLATDAWSIGLRALMNARIPDRWA